MAKNPSITLSKSKILFKKSKGQHILNSRKTIQRIVDKAGIFPSDVVLEIGPGTGNLTLPLLEKARRVVAVEIDERLILELRKRLLGTPLSKKLQLVQGDAIKTAFPPFDLLVANIPYQISSPLVAKLVKLCPGFRAAVVMFQKEFADRLVARPGDKNYARLSVNTQLFMRVERLLSVPRGLFKPPPKVDSAVVRLEPRRPSPAVDAAQWDALLRVCFLRKNKTLRAAFMAKGNVEAMAREHVRRCGQSKTPPYDNFSAKLNEFLVKEGCEQKRAAKMDVKDYVEFLKKLNENKFFFC